jgi:hypothetical protein
MVTGVTRNQGVGVPSPDMNYLWWEYLFGAVMCVCLYAGLVKWVSLWCGLMIRNSMRAIFASVAAVAGLAVVPYLAVLYFLGPNPLVMSILAMMCPASFIYVNEVGDLRTISTIPLMPAFIQILTQAAVLWLVRWRILRHADWYLGRIGKRPSRKFWASNPASQSLDLEPASPSEDLAHVVGAAR